MSDILRGVKRDHRALLKVAEKAGCVMSMTGKCHIRIECPSGEVVHSSLTASDHRSLLNLRAQLRRAGVEV